MSEKIYSIEEIKYIIVPILKKSDIRRAILFGSYAKGQATSRSDIDIFIDSDGKLNGFNFFIVYNEIENSLNKKVDLIEAIDVEEESEIYNEIEKYGVELI